jgi:hypothetical protein
MTDQKDLSTDAIVFGISYLNGSRSKLSFGGEGATMRITDRARAALEELKGAGRVQTAKADDQIAGREHYQGVDMEPHLGALARQAGLDPFAIGSEEWKWQTFVKIGGAA